MTDAAGGARPTGRRNEVFGALAALSTAIATGGRLDVARPTGPAPDLLVSVRAGAVSAPDSGNCALPLKRDQP
jgi:hypothetical protein